MSVRTTPAQRQEFFEQHQRGQTYPEIAQAADVSVLCVRNWCRRQRKGGTATTTYRRQPSGLLACFPPLVRYALLRLRLEHPHWGPGRLRYHLQRRPSLAGLLVPSLASIGYYLHQWQCFRRPPRPVPLAPLHAPTEVHEQWELDYKMRILVDKRLINLVDVRDRVGAAVIGSIPHVVQEPSQRATFPEIRADVRQCLAQWQTLPDRIQTDNEAVFAGRPDSHFPSLFTLWLKGLGINHVCIRPGQPTDNAGVERQHRTVMDYALVGVQSQTLDLPTRLAQAAAELNGVLPSQATGCHGQPPLVAHPDLLVPRRPFQMDHELAQFDLKRVDAYLATFTWVRQVGKKGQVTLGGYHHVYSVGHQYAGQHIAAHFDPTDRSFVFVDAQKQEIQRRPAKGLSLKDMTGWDVWPAGVGVQQLPLQLTFA